MPQGPIAIDNADLIPQGGVSIKNITTPMTVKAAPGTVFGYSVIAAAVAKSAAANTSLSWLAGVVTVTTAAAHGIPLGDTITVTIAGVTASGYNGTFQATSTGTDTFTYPLVSDPGSETVPGTWVMVPTPGSINDCTTAGAAAAGNQVLVIANTVGTSLPGIPCDDGITIVPPVANGTPAAATIAVWFI